MFRLTSKDVNVCFLFSNNRREKQLKALLQLYEENEVEMCNALAADLRKSRQESIINEVELLRNDVRGLIMHLREYAKPEYVMHTANAICLNN